MSRARKFYRLIEGMASNVRPGSMSIELGLKQLRAKIPCGEYIHYKHPERRYVVTDIVFDPEKGYAEVVYVQLYATEEYPYGYQWKRPVVYVEGVDEGFAQFVELPNDFNYEGPRYILVEPCEHDATKLIIDKHWPTDTDAPQAS